MESEDQGLKGLRGEDLGPVIGRALEQIKELGDKPQAVRYTVDGEVLVRKKDGEILSDYLEVVPYEEPPRGFKDRHGEMMGVIYDAATAIKSMQNRAMPLTRNELLRPKKAGGVTEKGLYHGDLDALEKAGYVVSRIVAVTDTSGKKMPARAVVYFTPKGRAFIRHHFDPGYGLPVVRGSELHAK